MGSAATEAVSAGRTGAWVRASPFAAAAGIVAGFTALRLLVLFATPLELYPDEAQYWAWAQSPALGYVSKPPLVAWLIWLTTGIGGDAEAWVRLAAPLVHAGAALALQRAGARLYGGWTGFWAAVLYMLMPGVQLSAGVITTDAPLFLFLALSLWAYAATINAADPAERLRSAAFLGLALGLAWLSKYAAIYFVIGLVLHAALDAQVRAAWGRRAVVAAVGLCALTVAPNLAWNLDNGFATLGHTLQNASWGPALPNSVGRPDGPDVYDFRDAPGFLLSQFGVFGPIPFAVLMGGAVMLARRAKLLPQDRMLLCFVIPPLLIVLVQAALSRANANWGAAGYGAASVLVAAWLVRWKAKDILVATLSFQGAFAALFLVLATWPPLADRLGLANSFKHARGWAAITQGVLDKAEGAGARIVAVDDRFLFNAVAYYGRRRFDGAGAPRLTMWMRRPRGYTQAEMDAPLAMGADGRILGASLESVYLQEMLADFSRVTPLGVFATPLDPQRRREVGLFVGEDFRPGPRDPGTGLPILGAPPVEG
jgi:4-amino-4-deoxy-L-arabinose transferase-like glycosyltransferase